MTYLMKSNIQQVLHILKAEDESTYQTMREQYISLCKNGFPPEGLVFLFDENEDETTTLSLTYQGVSPKENETYKKFISRKGNVASAQEADIILTSENKND